MALFKQEELPVLVSALNVKSVADSAPLEAEKMAIAKLINSAANTGQYSVTYNHEISDDMKDILKGMSYKVTNKSQVYCADPKYQYTISWK